MRRQREIEVADDDGAGLPPFDGLCSLLSPNAIAGGIVTFQVNDRKVTVAAKPLPKARDVRKQ